MSVPPAPSAPPAPSRRHPAGPSSCLHWRHLSDARMTLIRRGSSTRERPFRTWVRGVTTVVRHTRQLQDVGVDTAAANFGLLIVPRSITNPSKNSVRANESVGHASDGCGDHRKPHRRTARVCGVDQWCTDRGVYLSCCSSSNVDSRTGDCASSRPFQRQYFITCKREEVLIQRLYIGYCCSTPGSTAAAINLGCRNGKLHVCVV